MLLPTLTGDAVQCSPYPEVLSRRHQVPPGTPQVLPYGPLGKPAIGRGHPGHRAGEREGRGFLGTTTLLPWCSGGHHYTTVLSSFVTLGVNPVRVLRDTDRVHLWCTRGVLPGVRGQLSLPCGVTLP